MARRVYRSFFFQAEDGIRDVAVTGVQTCALPISILLDPPIPQLPDNLESKSAAPAASPAATLEEAARVAEPERVAAVSADESLRRTRTGERRGGEEGRSRWWPCHLKKKYEYSWDD